MEAIAPPPSPSPAWRGWLGREWPLLLVLAMAIGLAGWAYAQFLPEARQLWWSLSTDRNAHYWMSQSVGLDLRNGDMVHLARDVERMRIWGPLFPLVTGVVLAVGGPDYRVAVLISLAAWVGAALFAFLAARRAAPRGGNLAGAVAALFVMASPAYHAFATDIMLEGPGACLSLAVVYAYLRARQQPGPASFRGFGLALTALFYLKYNYWLLALFAVVATECCRWAGPLARAIRAAGESLSLAGVRPWCWSQVRHPLTVPLGAIVVLLAIYIIRGPVAIPLGQRTLTIQSADTLADVACWIVLARGFLWWLRSAQPWLRARSDWACALVNWHFWPAAAWFLLPKRAASCVEYLTRNHGTVEGEGFLWRLNAYTASLATNYHAGMAVLVVVACLVSVAFLMVRRLRPGGALLVWFLVISASLTVLQSFFQSRFMHSWFAVTWVAAGAGLAGVIYGWRREATADTTDGLGNPSYRHGGGSLRHGLACAAIGLLAVLCGPRALGPGSAAVGGPDCSKPCVLPLAERLLPELDGTRRVAILSNNPLRFFAMWTYQERYQRTEGVFGELYMLPADATEFEMWANRSECDAVVWIDVPRASPMYSRIEVNGAEQVQRLMAGQADFHTVGRREWPELGCSAQIWRRAAPVAGLGR